MKKWLEVASQSPPAKAMQHFVTPEMETCAVIVEIFHRIPAASARFVDALVPVLTKSEITMNLEVRSRVYTHNLEVCTHICIFFNFIKKFFISGRKPVEKCVIEVFGQISDADGGLLFIIGSQFAR